jgi:hypothetical protein
MTVKTIVVRSSHSTRGTSDLNANRILRTFNHGRTFKIAILVEEITIWFCSSGFPLRHRFRSKFIAAKNSNLESAIIGIGFQSLFFETVPVKYDISVVIVRRNDTFLACNDMACHRRLKPKCVQVVESGFPEQTGMITASTVIEVYVHDLPSHFIRWPSFYNGSAHTLQTTPMQSFNQDSLDRRFDDIRH